MGYQRVDKNFITPAAKLILLKKGQYGCDIPPVPTGKWSDQNWIDWIDNNGHWWSNTYKKAKGENV